MVIPEDLAARERRGAYLEIHKKDGQVIKGYLVAVKIKQKSLLLVEKKERTALTMSIYDASVIIRKKSFVLDGLGFGAAAGAVVGGLIYKDPGPGNWMFDFGIEFNIFAGMFLGGGVGAAVGAMVGIYQKIEIQGKSEAEIEDILDRLRKKARIPDYN